MRSGIIPLEANPDPETAQDDTALRIMLDDLRHAGHVVVDAPATAARVWLAATRGYPEADVILSRVRPGYRIEMEFRRSL